MASGSITSSANNSTDFEYSGITPDLERRSQTTFKVGIFTGADYYILSRLYIGAELGLSFNSTKQKEYSIQTITGSRSRKDVVKDYSKENRFGFFCIPSFRIGWNF